MEPAFIGLLSAGLILFLLICGVWIGAALGIVGIIAFFLYGGWQAVPAVGHITFNCLTSYDFVSLPLFIFMATILANCGVSERIYAGSAAIFARFPGGLLHANVAGCALFASICGSTAATCAAMSTIALPELEKRGYPEAVSLGSLAASGTLGPLIPPSIGFIIYGVITETSIGQLFMAGIIPGIMLASLFMGYIFVRSLIKKDIKTEKKDFKETVLRLLSLWPVVVLFLLVIGTIYLGICTVVEAGSFGCVGALLVAIFFRQLTRKNLFEALRQGTNITVLIFFILLGGVILGHGLSNYGVPQYLLEMVIAAELSQYQFLGVLTIFYLILGMFLDGAAIMVVTLPIIFPVVSALGIHPVWYGVVMVLFCDLAAITPPVGVNLFVLQGITQKPLERIVKGIIPFILALLFVVLILVIWPWIPLILPNMMF